MTAQEIPPRDALIAVIAPLQTAARRAFSGDQEGGRRISLALIWQMTLCWKCSPPPKRCWPASVPARTTRRRRTRCRESSRRRYLLPVTPSPKYGGGITAKEAEPA